MNKTLVTGASGFVGGNLVGRLYRQRRDLRVFVLPGEGAPKFRMAGIEAVEGDLVDPEAVDRAVRGCDFIYHVAALYRPSGVPDRMYHEVNVRGTRHLLESAKRHGVRRVVHVSTVGVHGHIAHPPANEEDPFSPRDAYQRSKCEGELLARRYFADGLNGSVVRPVGIYGPGDTRFLKLFRAIQKRRFVMLGSGLTLYQMTYIDDLIDAMMLCMHQPQALGEVFIIGGEESATTLNDIVAAVAVALEMPAPRMRMPVWPFRLVAPVCLEVCRAIGVEPPLFPRRLEFFTDNRSFDILKAKLLLGYRPKVGLEEGIRRTLAWFRDTGLLPPPRKPAKQRPVRSRGIRSVDGSTGRLGIFSQRGGQLYNTGRKNYDGHHSSC